MNTAIRNRATANRRPLHLALLLCPALLLAGCQSTAQVGSTTSGQNLQVMPPVASAQSAQPVKPVVAPAPAVTLGTPWNMPASFNGTLPCADCEGIATHLILLASHTYVLQETYLGIESHTTTQVGNWRYEDYRVLLDNPQRKLGYAVTSNHTLHQLDQDGQPIDSKQNYSLTLNQSDEDNALPLKGIFSYQGDIAVLKECSSGKTFQLTATPEALNLQNMYKKLQGKDKEALLAEVSGHLGNGDKGQDVLDIEQVQKLTTAGKCQ
ncbi:copper resistance protein NlpE N-terminal domain-containing protein [Pokkaliibacter sp. MBI-7]|uniref:copper resistance protein NlpE N-terminal domain-containing protein n=1 Tax=Pokkaliibacter sp. MBI-7 TaxID=3040600 RepID=UPI00244C2C17|nr:copper resistance protein NlpE N-terminal domain-containing protein [Pokkaliibacter sp. MBI-7]MDH2436070.1 copper resistance protein NlpE N-terminal domain-containing protein [Pokkaliibacter sp. MBI-7]